MSFRDIKKQSRRDLHDQMKVAAAVYVGGKLFAEEERYEISVRVHNKNVTAGDLAGTSLGYAEVREDNPQIVFDLLEYAPLREDVVILTATEGYRVQVVDPADGEFQVASVLRMSTAQLASYTPP